MITKKTAKTIQPGEIFRCEYGDYNNWCEFVFVSCEPKGKKWTKIKVRKVGKDDVFSIYDSTPIDKVTFDVIGKEALCHDNSYIFI